MSLEDFENAVSELRRIGLSRYEARAYLALLVMGELTPRDLSEITGIPYTKVYEVLKRLESKGWVRRVSDKPLVFAAQKPEEVIVTIREEFEAKLRRAERTLKRMEEIGLGLVKPAGMYMVRRIDALERIIRGIVAGAQREILVFAATSRFLGFLASLPKRPSSLKIIVREGMPCTDVGECRAIRALLPLNLVIADREKLVLGFEPLLEKGGRGVSGVVVLDRDVAETAAEYFETLWSLAKRAQG